MPDRAAIAQAAAEGLRRFADRVADTPVLIGFDGFVDSIIAVVDQRRDADHYDALPTIAQFGRKVLDAAGQSANFELVTRLQKLGGNGPILANALLHAGLPVTYVGLLGKPETHDVFRDFAGRAAEVHSLDEPGYTDALEFDDGKLMLGKHLSLQAVNAKTIREQVGDDRLNAIVARSALIGMTNWTMLPHLETIWRHLIDAVFPAIPAHADARPGKRRIVFIDLADPEKRTREDLRGALSLCTEMDRAADVILGLNLKESTQVAAVLDLKVPADAEREVELTAKAIRALLDIHGVVIHPRAGAAAAIRTAGNVESAAFAGPFVERPKLSTGAGDNFNAGFCLARLADLDAARSVCVGAAASGFYVRQARSATLPELADFCDHLPPPETP